MKRRLADRRAQPRFEIVGELWGSLEAVVRLQLRNVSHGGALVQADVPLEPKSEHHVTITCNGVPAPTKVRVSHVRRLPAVVGRYTYLIGVEFVNVGPVLRSQIDAWLLNANQAET
jgi:hypothetical protein